MWFFDETRIDQALFLLASDDCRTIKPQRTMKTRIKAFEQNLIQTYDQGLTQLIEN